MALAAALSSCYGEIYVRDGVTDGDTFYLSQQAITDSDPVLQSWVSYSLARSTCQLQIESRNPARENSYACELTARQHLLATWGEKKSADPSVANAYLDTLAEVARTGYLDEYVVHYFGRDDWSIPDSLEADSFGHWRRQNLRRHRPKTRIVGSWNFAQKVNSSAFHE